jgi:hypothetical protein
LIAGAIVLSQRGSGVDTMLPAFGGDIGFWVAVAAASAVAGVALLVVAASGGGRPAAAGFVAIALAEAALFAGPFNPRVSPADAQPRSQVLDLLTSLAGDQQIASTYFVLPPESAGNYGLHDVGAYDPFIDPRLRRYWSLADPDASAWTANPDQLHQYVVPISPNARWLAAAGVAYVLTPANRQVPGTKALVTFEQTTVSQVPQARPFAFSAASTTAVGNSDVAAEVMISDPLATVAVEGGCCTESTTHPATVRVTARDPEHIEMSVIGPTDNTVVIMQSYDPDWVARIDGVKAQVLPADIHFQAVRVPAGAHQVTLSYEPPSVAQGAVVSGVGLLLLVGLLATPAFGRSMTILGARGARPRSR